MLTLELIKTTPQTRQITTFQFASANGTPLPAYSAGAHVDFDLGPLGSRSYSLIDWSPTNLALNVYEIAVQREENGDGGSIAMHALQLGETIRTSAPTNDFALQDSPKPALLLAGGIGVTPLISLATSLLANEHTFAFHYAGRSAEGMAFVDALAAQHGDNFKSYTDDHSPINLDQIMSDHGSHAVYICGPKGMIDAARYAAETAGISPQDIHVELFATPETAATDDSFEIEIHDTGAVFTVPSDKSIIQVLEENGVDVMYDCQRGDCGICQTDVISGTPDHRDVVLSQSEKDAGKVMQICVSRAKSARLVLDI